MFTSELVPDNIPCWLWALEHPSIQKLHYIFTSILTLYKYCQSSQKNQSDSLGDAESPKMPCSFLSVNAMF